MDPSCHQMDNVGLDFRAFLGLPHWVGLDTNLRDKIKQNQLFNILNIIF